MKVKLAHLLPQVDVLWEGVIMVYLSCQRRNVLLGKLPDAFFELH